MGESILVRRNHFSPSPTSFALIKVTYTQNTTCTCYKGAKVLSTNDRSGQYVFVIPETGTWTVKCTDGTNTNTKTVSITKEGQIENVNISTSKYIYFYNRGTQNIPWSSGGTVAEINNTNPGATDGYDDHVTYGRATFGTDSIRIFMEEVAVEGGVARAYTTDAIDVTNINTLYIVTTGGTGQTSGLYADIFGLGTVTSAGSIYGVTEAASKIIPASDTEITTNLNVSSISGKYQIFITHPNRYAYYPDLYVYAVYGE